MYCCLAQVLLEANRQATIQARGDGNRPPAVGRVVVEMGGECGQGQFHVDVVSDKHEGIVPPRCVGKQALSARLGGERGERG